MPSAPFDPATDLAPIPFDERLCEKARELKEAGLRWRPHAGCFVWDPEETLTLTSPFPQRIYFLLDLEPFIERCESLEAMSQRLIWLPTWHQARRIASRLDVALDTPALSEALELPAQGGEELLLLYDQILDRLRSTH